MSSTPVSLSAYARLLRGNRNFRTLWAAQIVSEVGDWLYTVAIYSLLLELTGSAKSIAFAFVTQVLPQALTAPTAGVINDRLSRRRVMIFADFARAVIVIGMLVVRSVDWLWFLYLLLLLETVMWGLFEPARNAVIPNITQGRDTLVANALSSTTWSFNFMIGSALGGALAAAFGRDTVFLLNALSFVVSGILIRRMRFEETHALDLPPLRLRDLADFSPVLEGVRYVRRDARLLATLFLKGGLGIIGTNWVILPLLGEYTYPLKVAGFDDRRAGMLGMSVLMGCRGLGALIGPFIAGYVFGHEPARLRRGVFYGFLIAAVGYALVGAAPTLTATGLAVMLAHAGASVVWVFSTNLLQGQTEDRFRGRVFSTEFALLTLALAMASGLGGAVLDWGLPVKGLAWATAGALLVPAGLWILAQRHWRRP